MHAVLASADPADPALAPSAMTPFHVRSLYQSVRARVNAAREGLEARLPSLGPRERAAAGASLVALGASTPSWRRCGSCGRRASASASTATCTWGTSSTPATTSSSSTSRATPGGPSASGACKRPALTDLASLVRSFHFAAHWPGAVRELLDADAAAHARGMAWSTFWFQWMSAACVRGYRAATAGAAFVPADDEAWSVMLEGLLVSRACDELTSRPGPRSDWLGLPLAGLDELLGGAARTIG